jgi:hypothetical protein
MKAIGRPVVALALVSALAAGMLAPAANADPGHSATPARVTTGTSTDGAAARRLPTIDPPTWLDARLSGNGERLTVAAFSRVRLRGSATDPAPDRVSVLVSVRDPRTGRLLHGPVRTAEAGVNEPGAAITIAPDSGEVRIRLDLTAEQRRAVMATRVASGQDAAAASVRVRLTQAADLSSSWPGREAMGVVQDQARWGGRAPARPPVATRAGNQYVTMQNSTTSPLILMAGPAQCIYDNVYAGTQKMNQQSFLGSMNGTLLPPGSSLTVAITKDDDDLDGKDGDFDYQQVLDDYQQAQQDTYAWLQEAGIPTLPGMGFPYTSDNPMGLPWELWQTVGLFVGHAVLDMLTASGLWGTTLARLMDAYPDLAASFARLDAAFSPLVDYALSLFEVVIAVVEGLYALFSNGCGSNAGYFLIGATDAYHPWRTFAQVYNWNGGSVEVAYDSSAKKDYVAYSNGIVTRTLEPQPLVPPSVPANELGAVFLPGGPPGQPVFDFQVPPNRAEYPAVISVDRQTRRVTCGLDPSDARALAANLTGQRALAGTSQYLVAYPGSVWADLDTGATTETAPAAPPVPYDYLVGYQYSVPAAAPTATVYWSPDAQSFQNSLPIPAGQDSVVLPDTGEAAALVTCVVQAPEMWNIGQSPLPTKRGLLMGTLVPSDVVQGPDYPAGG